MTKEEYEKLLSSDYWKGYSYSLIKERNFTCEDCGKSFFNERHKLQVHHLVYRDVNPWSYKPEEVVVLCRECHERRHGIISRSEVPSPSYDSVTYSRSYISSAGNRYDKSYSSNSKVPSSVDNDTRSNDKYSQSFFYHFRAKEFKFKYALLGIAALLIFIFGWNLLNHSQKDIEKETQEVAIESVVKNEDVSYSAHKEKSSPKTPIDLEDDFVEVEEVPDLSLQNTDESVTSASTPTGDKQVETPNEKSTLELLEEINHADVVKRAKRAGVSTEGSTVEILERITRKELE